MTDSVRVEEVDDVLFFAIPDELADLPRELLEGRATWLLYRTYFALGLDRELVRPPDEVEILLTDSVDEVRAMKLRHDCNSCRDGVQNAIKALERGRCKVVMLAQFRGLWLR